MEDSKANPNFSWPPSPLPSWEQAEALRGSMARAVSASAWPHPDTEEKKGPCDITEEKKPGRDVKPSQGGDVQAGELRLQEEARGCESYQVVQAAAGKEASPCRAGGLYQRMVAVRVQRGDVTVGELPRGEKEFHDPEVPQRWDDQYWKYYTQTELFEEWQGEAPELSDAETSVWGSSSEDLDVSMEEVNSDNSSDDLTYVTYDSQLSITSFTSSFGATPVSQDELSTYDGDELSVLEWHEEDSSTRSLATLAADGLPVPAPREAWVEDQEPESLPASVPSAPQAPQQQPAAPSKRPGRLRRALRALRALRTLLCWPCLSPQPQD